MRGSNICNHTRKNEYWTATTWFTLESSLEQPPIYMCFFREPRAAAAGASAHHLVLTSTYIYIMISSYVANVYT